MVKKVASRVDHVKWLKTVEHIKSTHSVRVFGRCLCLERAFFRKYTHHYDGTPYPLGWCFYPLA